MLRRGRRSDPLRPPERSGPRFAHLGPAKKDPTWHAYRAEDDTTPAPKPSRNGTHPPSYINWPAKAKAYAAQLTAEARRELADALGLPVGAFEVFPLLGYAPDDPEGPAWTFPECDGADRVIGIGRRWRDGRKKAMLHSGRGLTLTRGCRGGTGPLPLVEGASDTLALRLCGIAAVGRPSNTGGVDDLAELLKDVPADRRVVVVGENDQKPDGLWPGKDGAVRAAAALSAKRGRKVEVALPPDGAKDCRAWVLDQAAGSSEAVDWPAIGRQLLDRLELVEAADPPGLFSAGDQPDVTLSDVGNARRFVAEFGADVRYVSAWGKFLTWDGARWQVDQRLLVEDLAKRTAVRMVEEAAADLRDAVRTRDAGRVEAAEAKYKWAKKALDARAIQRALGLFRSDPAVALTPDALDTDPWVLNCQNGTIDLRTGELRPHLRRDYLTKLCPTRYDPAAACPAWEGFLGSIFATDRELIGFIRRLLGYCLTGDTREHVLPVLWGDGSNGKSTFVELAMAVLGPDYAGKADQDLLLAKRGEAHPTGRVDLRGKRLVVATETADGRRLDEPTVKELTDGDTIKARFMRQDFFEFAPTHKLVLCSNYKPEVRGTDAGIWRRLRLVPFAQRFWNPDEPARAGEDRPDHLRADKGMRDKLLAEREGILAWMVAGCREWQAAGGLGMPAAGDAATVEYRAEQDLFGRFAEERCERGEPCRVKSSALYAAFKTWCTVNGVDDVPSLQSFGQSVVRAGFERKASNGTWYLGLRLTDPDGDLGP